MFLRFTALSIEDDLETIYNRVAQVLIGRYGLVENGGRATLQARSIRIDFARPTGQADLEFSVDAVPAVPFGEHWAIPNKDRRSWTEGDARWIKTSPLAFAAAAEALSIRAGSPTVGARNAFKPVVRLLRQVRHTHLGDERPGGLYVEIAAYYAWDEGRVVGDSWAELLSGSLRELAVEFERAESKGLADPILKTPLAPALAPSHWRTAARTFDELADFAEQALAGSRCGAAKLWRQILGSNERGSILPLPPGCGADGRPVALATAVTATGPSQARGFAQPTA